MVTWDLAHNGASCAFVLADLLRREYDVELIGPTFLGAQVWAPIRDADIPIRTFPGRELPHFIEDAERAVSDVRADVILACKPRFPTLLLSMLITDQCGAPVILHVDDFESGLVGAGDAISLDELERQRGATEFADPVGRLWVAACERLVGDADAITVSGDVLRRRYGGTVLGQPRDELRFDPARFDRRAVRAEFGYADEDRVVLFLGSPRPHKGIRELAAAVVEIDDPHVKLCVIGSFNDGRLRAEIGGRDRRRIQLLDYRPVAEVPRLTMIGDLVCLPQDPSAEFVAYQTPMKLTEAIAMGIPVLARATPSLAPFVQRGLVVPIGDAPLSQRIAAVLADACTDAWDGAFRRGRAFFLEDLSYAAALTRINRVIAGLPRDHAEIPPRWERACDIASSASTAGTPVRRPPRRASPGR